MRKWVVVSIIWSLGGSLDLSNRMAFSRTVENLITTIEMPNNTSDENSLLEFNV
jgi:hypothetical protein